MTQRDLNDSNWHKVTQIYLKCFTLTQSDSKWFKVIQSDSKWLKVTQSDSTWLKVTQSDSKWLKVLKVTQSDSKWLKVPHSDLKWLKVRAFFSLSSTVPCKVLGKGFFRRADSFTYISCQGMTSLDLCLQLIRSGQGNQPRRRQPALVSLTSPRHHWREAGGHWR